MKTNQPTTSSPRQSQALSNLTLEQLEAIARALRPLGVNRCSLERDRSPERKDWRRRVGAGIQSDIAALAALLYGSEEKDKFSVGDVVQSDEDDQIEVVCAVIANSVVMWTPSRGLELSDASWVSKVLRKATPDELAAAALALEESPLDLEGAEIHVGDLVHDTVNSQTGIVIATVGPFVAYRAIGGAWHSDVLVITARSCRVASMPKGANNDIRVERIARTPGRAGQRLGGGR